MKLLFLLATLLVGCSVRDDGKMYLVECPEMPAFELRRDGDALRDSQGRRVHIPQTCKATVYDNEKS